MLIKFRSPHDMSITEEDEEHHYLRIILASLEAKYMFVMTLD